MKVSISRSALALALLSVACGDGEKNGAQPGPDGGDASVADAATPEDAGGDASSVLDASSDGGAPDAAQDAGQPACDASKAPDVSGLGLRPVVEGVERLVYAAQPKGTTDWYLVRQTGQIMVKRGDAAPTLFMDLSSEIDLSDDKDERGLLGVAFPPDFQSSSIFYVMLTPTRLAGANTDQVRQYKHTGSDVDLVDTLLNIPASAANHNGGTLEFGPDGYLYVGTGDGGGGCNTVEPGGPQDPKSLRGKILRLDVTNKAGKYAAPNPPFADSPLVWHLGLRNPFRWHIDQTTGEQLIADVGQSGVEEVDIAAAGSSGLNFGWPLYEGLEKTCAAFPGTLTAAQHSKPIAIADRKGGCNGDSSRKLCDWVSVIGGLVYRGSALPKLQGTYVFGDYVGQRMVALQQCEGSVSPLAYLRKTQSANEPNTPYLTTDDATWALTAIVEDNQRELYFVVNRSSLQKLVAR